MKIVAFFKSPLGNLVLLLLFLAVGGLMAYRSHAEAKPQAQQMTTLKKSEGGVFHATIVRASAVFKPAPVGASVPAQTGRALGNGFEPDAPLSASSRPHASEPQKPRLPPLSLIQVSKEEPAALSKIYAPYGRLIPCETVTTLESSKLDTPVIALVTEDVWHNGRLIIPAGAEVHGRAALDRARERIAASGRWVIVWRDGSAMNGTELVLSGIALEREKGSGGEFGPRDGSAGLIGDLIRSDNLQELKLFASTFLAGVASGLQPTQTEVSALGATEIASGSARDAALHGTADVLNAYARQIQEAISRDGFFVRVPAGKQFYLYVTETIDQERGTRGNSSVEDLWKKSHEN